MFPTESVAKGSPPTFLSENVNKILSTFVPAQSRNANQQVKPAI